MARERLVSRVMCVCTVSQLLFLFVIVSSVESDPNVVRRRIAGTKPLTIEEMSFSALRKEADKHVETFFEGGEYDVKVGGPNASQFHIAVQTDPPLSSASSQQQQLQQATQQQPQNQKQPNQSKPAEPVKQQKSQMKKQPVQLQKSKQHLQQQLRRHHRKVRDAVDDFMMDAIVMEDEADAWSVARRQRKAKRREEKRRRDEKTDAMGDQSYDKYFRKRTLDDYFRRANEREDDGEMANSEKWQRSVVANGIETDVTMVDDPTAGGGGGGGGMSMDLLETDVIQRDISVGDVSDPEKDGTLTLGRLESVLNSNESIDKLQLFSDNPALSVRWDEPAMMSNCWLHKLLANRYSFSPACKPDGTYYNKQCYLERCWCVDNEGRPRDRKFLTRFAYKKYGSLLYCTPQLHAVVGGNLLRPPESDFQLIEHTAPPPQQQKKPSPSAVVASSPKQGGSVFGVEDLNLVMSSDA